MSNVSLSKSLRIGIDCRLWGETGVGRYIRNLVTDLQKIDKTNSYILFVISKDIPQITSSIINKSRSNRGKWSIVVADIRWHSVKEQLFFPKILNKEKLDLVHFPYFSVPIFYKKPYVVTVHDVIIHQFLTGKASTLPMLLYFLKWKGYEFVLSQALKHAKKIITVSNAVSGQLQKEFGVKKDNITVIYEGVDARIKKQETRNKKQASTYKLPAANYFLYVGNVYPHKNVEKLVEAFGLILGNSDIRENAHNIAISKYPNIKLVIVGKEDYFVRRLKQQVKNIPYASDILFLPSISDAELANLYQHAIALVTPSLMEGFGLPALEAMANNCRVIASKIPVYEEVLKDKAILFDPNSTKSLLDAMKQAIAEIGEKKKAHLENARKYVEIFSWSKMAKNILRVYKNAL